MNNVYFPELTAWEMVKYWILRYRLNHGYSAWSANGILYDTSSDYKIADIVYCDVGYVIVRRKDGKVKRW